MPNLVRLPVSRRLLRADLEEEDLSELYTMDEVTPHVLRAEIDHLKDRIGETSQLVHVKHEKVGERLSEHERRLAKAETHMVLHNDAHARYEGRVTRLFEETSRNEAKIWVLRLAIAVGFTSLGLDIARFAGLIGP